MARWQATGNLRRRWGKGGAFLLVFHEALELATKLRSDGRCIAPLNRLRGAGWVLLFYKALKVLAKLWSDRKHRAPLG